MDDRERGSGKESKAADNKQAELGEATHVYETYGDHGGADTMVWRGALAHSPEPYITLCIYKYIYIYIFIYKPP